MGDSYLLVTRPSPQQPTLELRFQFRYAASPPPRWLKLDPQSLWFCTTAGSATAGAPDRRKVEKVDVTEALAQHAGPLRYNQLRQEIMQRAHCSKRTAQLAICQASQQGLILQSNGQYRLPG